MDCARYREVISAQVDGEESPVEAAAVDAHAAVCRGCRQWAEAVSRLARLTRVAPAPAVPDLTAAIVARAAGTPDPANPWVLRLGLLMVALVQFALAIPALLGDDGGAPVHVAHEQGSWSLALAVAFLAAAWRPGRAAAMLPVVGALVLALAVTMAADVAAGRTQASAESPHGLAFLGLGLLWMVVHPARGVGRRAAPAPGAHRVGGRLA